MTPGPGTPAAAVAEARRTGKPAEVTTATRATQRTTANPDGTLTTRINAQPVRAKQHNTWVDLDPTLRANPDGTFSPAVSTGTLVLSGGGTRPLATMGNGAAELALTWPAALPKPTIAGTSATYPAVLPGVDLVVTATAQGGFSHVLVVHDATAATNPALAHLQLTTTAKGVHLDRDPAGALIATDPHGQIAFTAPPARMWDSTLDTATADAASASGAKAGLSTGDGDAARSSKDQPGRAARQGDVEVHLTGTGLQLTPDAGMLARKDLTWPVFIDPSWNPTPVSAGRAAWAYVNSTYPNSAYFNGSDYARVGYNGWESPYFKARSFFQFNVPSSIWGTHIVSATLQTNEVWSGNGSSAWIDVYHTCAISAATTWNNQPCQGGRIDRRNTPGDWRADGSYNPIGQDFDITSEITSAAAGSWATDTLGLFNETETDRNAWRKFANNPTIAITYNTVPTTPTNVTTSPMTVCNAGATGALSQVGRTAVTFSAILNDPDGSQGQVEGDFTITDQTTGTVVATPTVTVSNNQVASVSLPAIRFTDGHTYGWSVRANDGRDTGPASPTCQFVVNQQQPGAPTVASTSYPTNATGAAVRTAAEFTFTPPAGTSAPISYVYALNTPTSAVIPTGYGPTPGGTLVKAASATGPTSVTITPNRVGPNTLYVYAINAAGNPSATTAYRFSADLPATPAGFGDLNGDTNADLLTIGSSLRPGLWLSAGTDHTGHLTSPVQIGAAGTGTTGDIGSVTDWTGAGVATADFDGDGAQDVLVRSVHTGPYGNVTALKGAGDGSPLDPAGATTMLLPKTDASPGYQVVDQIAAPPLTSVSGMPFPDLYAIVGDNLYLYTPLYPQGTYDQPQLLGSGWSGHTITGATAGPNPVLFSRTTATGRLEAWTGNTDTSTPAASTGSTPVVYATTGYSATAYPTITGAEINLDGQPDLWATTNGNQLVAMTNTGTNTLTSLTTNPTGTTTLIRSAIRGKCVDNANRATANGNPINLSDCNGDAGAQQWTVPGDGTIRVQGKCLDVVGSNPGNGAVVQLWDCLGTTGQQWTVQTDGTLKNTAAGRCLEDPNSSTTNGTRLQVWDCTSTISQRWSLDTAGLGPVRSGLKDKCLDNANNALTNGNPIQLYDCQGTTNQTWTFTGDGTIRNGGILCLDVTGGGTANGTLVQLWACNNSLNQQWQTGPNHTLINPQSGRCLTDPNDTTTNGTRLQIADCTGATGQQWSTPAAASDHSPGQLANWIRHTDSTWQTNIPMTECLDADTFQANTTAITAMPDGTTQFLVTGTDDVLYHNIRNTNGTCAGFTPLAGAWGSPRFQAAAIAIAGMPDGTSQILATGVDGTIYHNIRNTNGTWQGFNSLGFQAKSIAITATPSGAAQLAVVGLDNNVYHNIRNTNGTWQGFNSLGFQAKTAAIAGMPDGSAHIVATNLDTTLYHNIRFANGTWQGFNQTGGAGGAPSFQGANIAITAMPDGAAHITATGNDSTIYHNIRFANGTWQGFNFLNSSPVLTLGIAGTPTGELHILATH